jgi:hypothetical protein
MRRSVDLRTIGNIEEAVGEALVVEPGIEQ